MPATNSAATLVMRLLVAAKGDVAAASVSARAQAKVLEDAARVDQDGGRAERIEAEGNRTLATHYANAADILDAFTAEGVTTLGPYSARLRCTAAVLIEEQKSRPGAVAFAQAAERNAWKRHEDEPDESHDDTAMWWGEVAAFLETGVGR